LSSAIAALKLGLPSDRDTEVGCLSSQTQFDKTLSYINIGLEDGARLAQGGRWSSDPRLAGGAPIRGDRSAPPPLRLR
jgi:acyl-CoA reductase-like NAD-dependent aldehyde dehydrogenase